MKSGLPLKQDPGRGPDGKPAAKADGLSFKGPFRHITACLEKTGHNRKDRWCLMFITDSVMIIMPVPRASSLQNQNAGESPGEPGRAKPHMKQLYARDSDSVILERLEDLVEQYREKDPEEVFIAEPDTNAVPLDTIEEITITWVSRSGRYSWFLFPFSMYPAEPANAGYRVNFQVVVTTGKKNVVVITPFSPELRETLRNLLGKKVHEIPDEYAPLF